ncbi:unnamed protein product [Thlaspi arvense]|uniref:Uncharacterized protein n=1 Tax=Thlaspi arvense TaxID=13288 RepID=A0AAU9SP74_THLAR|nr:unnamed protein product [Thlaspi arvense]
MLDERPMPPQELVMSPSFSCRWKLSMPISMTNTPNSRGKDIDGHLAATILEQRIHNLLGTAPLSFEDPKHKVADFFGLNRAPVDQTIVKRPCGIRMDLHLKFQIGHAERICIGKLHRISFLNRSNSDPLRPSTCQEIGNPQNLLHMELFTCSCSRFMRWLKSVCNVPPATYRCMLDRSLVE